MSVLPFIDNVLTEDFLLVADDYRHVIYQLHPYNVTDHLTAIRVHVQVHMYVNSPCMRKVTHDVMHVTVSAGYAFTVTVSGMCIFVQ